MPLRENVRFFESAVAASQAGYRACKRCRPERSRSPELELVERACRRIETSERLPSLAGQARAAGLSSSRFHKLFKATLGITPKQYAAAHRAGRLRRALEAGQSVTRAIHEARYSSASRVYENADALLGMPPKTYARGGEGEIIRVGVERCSLGWVLVATTEGGVCAVDLGESRRALLASFEQRFAKAVKKPPTAESRRFIRAVVRQIDAGPRRAQSSLPLDLWGTAFQVRVWCKLRDIPRGRTKSYSELARELGAPRAARAVASACAKNPLAVLVPCHRVLRKDGALGGYRWGLGVKRALLARERKG
jgi:AraC family transcriptional regulator of adaptative response/methylated-DNA-[protein]-cysteine methyltransferase